MAEFTPITTQEEFDNAIKERIARTTKSVTDEVTKKFEGYISPDDFGRKTADFTSKIETLTNKSKEYDTTIADLTAKNKAYETSSVKMRVARDFNIPYELSEKISGETEEEIKADAEKLSKFIGKPAKTPPLFTPETQPEDKTKASLLKLANSLHGGE